MSNINKISKEQFKLLDNLVDLVLEYNTHTNITGIKDKDTFLDRQINDSLELLNIRDISNKNILDVGTGGGFPGLALAIIEPTSNFTLLDSNNKKIKFVSHAIDKLSLKNVSVENSRIESKKGVFFEKFDFTLSRAVAPLNVLLELTSFTIKIGGELVLWKGSKLNEETPKDWNSISDLGVTFQENHKYSLEDSIDRNLLILNKTKQSAKSYPRDYAKIKADPLF